MTAKKSVTKTKPRAKAPKARTASPKPSKRQKRRKRGATDDPKRQQLATRHNRSQRTYRHPREHERQSAPEAAVEPASLEHSAASHCTEVQWALPKPPLVQIAARTSRAIRYQCRGDATAPYSPRRRWLGSQARTYQRSLRQLKSITDPFDFQLAFHDHMASYANRIVVAAHQASRDCPLPLPADQLDRIAQAAASDALIEPILVLHDHVGRKRRTTYGYGISDKVRQRMVADVIRYIGPQPHNDFAAPGAGGRDAHVRHVCNLIRRGYCHVAASDIVDAFSSVRPDHIVELIPLPSSALENILFAGEPEGGGSGSDDTYEDEGCRLMAPPGLPQGSICSGPALSMVVGNVLRSLAEDAWDLSHYVDDIATCAQSHTDAEQLQLRLEEELLGLTGGGLRLHKTRFADFSRGGSIDLLGYHISSSADGDLSIRPSRSSWEKADDECFYKLRERYELERLTYNALFDIAHDYFMGWAASHGEWRPRGGQDKRFIAGCRASKVHERFCDEHDIAAPWEW